MEVTIHNLFVGLNPQWDELRETEQLIQSATDKEIEQIAESFIKIEYNAFHPSGKGTSYAKMDKDNKERMDMELQFFKEGMLRTQKKKYEAKILKFLGKTREENYQTAAYYLDGLIADKFGQHSDYSLFQLKQINKIFKHYGWAEVQYIEE